MPILDEGGGGLADGDLVLPAGDRRGGLGKLAVANRHQHGAAANALDGAAVLQKLQIAANGLGTDAELFGQLLDLGRAVLFHHILDDLLLSGSCGHKINPVSVVKQR